MRQRPEVPLECVAVVFVVFGLMGLFMTAMEVLCPVMTLLTNISVITAFKSCVLFELAPKDIYYVAHIVIFVSSGLLVSMLWQYRFTFKKKVQLLRFILNFVYIGIIIYFMTTTAKENEDSFRKTLANSWNTSQVCHKFEVQFNCQGLKFMNQTTSQFCDSFVNEKIKTVYDTGRTVDGYFGLFITSVSVYSTIGILFNRM